MRRTAITVPIRKIGSGPDSRSQDFLAVEEPLQIRIDGATVRADLKANPGLAAEARAAAKALLEAAKS